MIIRSIVKSDMESVIKITQENVTSHNSSFMDYDIDVETMVMNTLHAIEHPELVIAIVAEKEGEIVGTIAGGVIHREHNNKIKGVKLSGWATKPGYGGTLTVKLIDAFLRRAKELDATATSGRVTGLSTLLPIDIPAPVQTI